MSCVHMNVGVVSSVTQSIFEWFWVKKALFLSSGKVAVSISLLDPFGENKSIMCKKFRNGTEKDLKNLAK